MFARQLAAIFLLLFTSAESRQPATSTISGRVITSTGAPTREPFLMLAYADGDSGKGESVAISQDGSFRTRELRPGRYLLVAGPLAEPNQPYGPAERAFIAVTVRDADVTSVLIQTRRSFLLHGNVRYDGEVRPGMHPSGNVFATPALDGIGITGTTPSVKIAADGTFALWVIPGPSVIRCGYGFPDRTHPWWVGPVLLDGRDITDVPTDFAQHPDGKVEFVFTQHPAGVEGLVIDESGQFADGATVVVFAADPKLWQAWATTSHVAATNAEGYFGLTLPPGPALAVALAHPLTRAEAFSAFTTLAKIATPFTVPTGRNAHITLKISRLPERPH
jgi:hypothetical protein